MVGILVASMQLAVCLLSYLYSWLSNGYILSTR